MHVILTLTIAMRVVLSSDSEDVLSSLDWYDEPDGVSCVSTDSYNFTIRDIEYCLKQQARCANNLTHLLESHVALLRVCITFEKAFFWRFRIAANCVACIVQREWSRDVDDTQNNTLLFDSVLNWMGRRHQNRIRYGHRRLPHQCERTFASNLWQICMDSNSHLNDNCRTRFHHLRRLSNLDPLSADQIYSNYLRMHELCNTKDLRERKWLHAHLALHVFTLSEQEDGLLVAVPVFIHAPMINRYMMVANDRTKRFYSASQLCSTGALKPRPR